MKISQLTFTRFLAALAIVVFHFNKNVYPFTFQPVKNITVFLNVLVSYFFVLSGFILTINAGEKVGLKRFYFNRFSRIYPVYIAALLFTVLLILDIRPLSFSWDFHRILLSALLLQSWHAKYALVFNYPAWSLSTEAFFYLLFPFVYNYLQQLPFKKRGLLVGLFWLLMQAVFAGYSFKQESFALYNPFFHLSTFLTGVFGGMLYKEKYDWLLARRKKLQHIFVLSTLVLLLLMISGNRLFAALYHNGLLAPYFMLLVFLLAEDWIPFTSWFGNRKPEYLGEISYGIYILQVPVYRLLSQTWKIDTGLTATGFFYIYVLVLIFVSIISYEIIEKPSRIFLRNYFNKTIRV